MSAIIHLDQVSKEFPTRRGFRDLRGRGGLGDWVRGRKETTFKALQDISLDIEPGESVGIIGRNGSGKSTLLSIIAGVTLPTEGRIQVFGRVASLLELGAGFNPILTGRENIYLNAGLLGMRHAQVDAVYDEIVRFSGIAEFIDQPVETYSSGMYVRIGFSVAAFVNPDIFLADEVLAVGDAEFQRKCRNKIGELREQKKTIVFVSHDLGIVNTLCERVILLDKGRMIQRGSAYQTITYYLRQVGFEKGLHTFSEGDTEAIHCDGRLSLFHRQHEVSAPSGFRMVVSSLGQDHYSTDAEWEVFEKGPNFCRVRGRMMRLPLSLFWEVRLEEGRLVWRISMELERECPITGIQVQAFFPTDYARWIYGDLSGEFPELMPSDLNWNVLVSPESKSMLAAALPREAAEVPPLMIEMRPVHPFFSMWWGNTEYVMYSRVLCAQARFSERDGSMTAGEHALLELIVDPTGTQESMQRQIFAERTVRQGRLSARFATGSLHLSWDDVEISDYLHVYASLLIEHLWNDSHSLQWSSIQPIEGGISFHGHSRRFPFAQEWRVSAVDDGIRLEIWMEADQELVVQECHTTIVLPARYTHWKTDHESAAFAPFIPDRTNWSHCNTSYRPGRFIEASGEGMPVLRLVADEACPQVRMTAINTSHQEHCRALQALNASDTGYVRFSAGRSLYFSGLIQASAPLSMPDDGATLSA